MIVFKVNFKVSLVLFLIMIVYVFVDQGRDNCCMIVEFL